MAENVKLLTFVSIFFLPLAFCTSLWSINNDLFALTTLIYVIIIVALATYLVVFNLNSIVYLSGTVYNAQKSNLLSRMKSDSSTYWKSRGEEFEAFSFKPRSEVVKPSEWLVGFYFLRLIPESVIKGMKRLREVQWRRKDSI
jgi:hypothetical protein